MKIENLRLVGDVLLVRLFRWDLDASVELGVSGISLDVIADFSDGGSGHRVGVRMGEVLGVGSGVGGDVWNSSMWRGFGGSDGYVVGVGDVVWFGWNMVRGFIEGRDWYDLEGYGRCVVLPYERVFCCVSGDDWGVASGLGGGMDFFGYVRGLNGFCLGLPYVYPDDVGGGGLLRGVGGVSGRVVRMLVVGGDVEYFHSDVYGVDGDVDLVVGGWYLLDGNCDLEVEGDYGRYFRVDGLGVYRFQKRSILAGVDGDLDGLIVGGGYVLPDSDLPGLGGGVDKADWDREMRLRDRVQRGSGNRYYF
jgi:hypothetical protein